MDELFCGSLFWELGVGMVLFVLTRAFNRKTWEGFYIVEFVQFCLIWH